MCEKCCELDTAATTTIAVSIEVGDSSEHGDDGEESAGPQTSWDL
jgi:hypothetical protein